MHYLLGLISNLFLQSCFSDYYLLVFLQRHLSRNHLSSCGYNHVTLLDGLSCKPDASFVFCSSLRCVQKSHVSSNRSMISSFCRFQCQIIKTVCNYANHVFLHRQDSYFHLRHLFHSLQVQLHVRHKT